MPTVTSGKYMWTRFKNVWANPTATTYTTPVLEQIAESIKEVRTKQAEYKQTLDEVSSTLTQTTTTANAAKTQASTNKQTIDEISSTLTSTTNTANNALNKATKAQQNLDGFKTTVSETYTTKTDFNNLSIGGRNLIRAKDVKNRNASSATFDKITNTWTIVATAGSGDSYGCGLKLDATGEHSICVPYGKTYVFSCEIKVPRNCTVNADINTYAKSGSSWAGNDNDTDRSSVTKSITTPNQWVKYWFKWSNTDAKNTDKVDLYDSSHFGVKMTSETSDMTYYVRNIQGEIGNVPTEWTPAPEDMATADRVTSLTTRVQKAEQKLTKDGITSIVGDYYAAGNATRDALSRIEQKADSVTTTVSNMKIGGTNLLLNTQFEGAVANGRSFPNWIITESCIIYSKYGQSGYNKMNTMYLGNENANSDGTKTGYMYHTLTSDRFQKNTEYTLSLDLEAEGSVKGWEVVIRYYDANSNLLANQVIFDNSTHSAGHLVSTFTSKNLDANMVQFCIGHKGSNNGASGYLLIVGNLMLEKGNIATGWQPSPQDMASKSIVTQTANEVKYQFQQAGGFPNLVANGSPTQTNDNNWWYWNATKYTGDNNYTELGFYSNNTSDNSCCIGTQQMVVSPGKTYSISFWAYCEPNVVNPHVIAKCSDSNNENYQYPKLCDLKLGNANDKKWYKYKINWTAPSGITRMQLCFHQKNHTQTQNYVTRIDQVMVIEGKDIFPTKWYPRFEEVESNTTSIDVNGVNVRHSSGARTNLNSRALNFYNSSGVLYAQVDGGKYHFWNDSTYVGFLGHTSWVNTNERVLTINADYNQTVALTGKVNSSDSSYQVWVVASPLDKTISGSVFHQGVTLIKPHTGGIFKFYGSSAHTDTYPGMIYATTDGHLCVKGDSYVELSIQVGNTGYNGLVITEIGENPYKKLDVWGRLDMHWWEIYNTNIVNNVSATSAQTYALRTSSTNEETYSDPTRKTITDIFSVQSPTEGDIRWSDRQTYFTSEVETGVYECYVEIPWWIAQNLENDYHVNITCTNGFYQYYVSERDPYYFIVRSDKDSMGFTFELCGKLLDNNTTANNGSVAGDQYLGHEIREDEEPLIVKDDGGSILENNTDTVINN